MPQEHDPLRPTIVSGAAEPPSSRARVGLRAGSTPRFADDTAHVLHQRLRAVAPLQVIIFALGLMPTLAVSVLWVRVLVLVVNVILCVWIRRASPRPLWQLRSCELAFFFSAVVMLTVMPSALILESARAGDFSAAVMDQYFAYGLYAYLFMGYGLYIPNTWQRAVPILLPTSLLPYLVFYLLGRYEPKVAEALASPGHGVPVPLPVAGALTSIYFAHLLTALRRDAFKARQLGQYRLKRKLGAGGMGEVYEAEHEMLKRPCAIKLIRPGIDAAVDAVARFEREVQATAQLSHPNTIEIFDYGRTDDGVFYYVMELLPGLSLDDLVEKHGPLPAARAVYLLRQVCSALEEAHGLGLIHRDLKPANIFAAQRGGTYDVAKLLDFGLVRQGSSGPDDARLTQQGMISGSPPYMSPEQANGSNIDARSDIYSLGAVAYCLVTGRPPFDGKTPMDYIIAHARDPVVPPCVRNDQVPADLEHIILRCLEKKPEDRFGDVRQLERALAACECAGDWDARRAADWWREHPQPDAVEPDEPDATLTRQAGPLPDDSTRTR